MLLTSVVLSLWLAPVPAPTPVPPASASGKTVLVAGKGLQEPFGVAFDDADNVYIVEMGGNRISVVRPSGEQRVLAGTGEEGFSGDGGPAAAARFSGPHHLMMGPDKHLYVADTGNHCIRRIDLATGIVTTVAGNGEKGVPRDGGDALREPLVDPRAIAVDSRGNLYICERAGNALRVVTSAGKISTVAGTGEEGATGDGGPARAALLRGPKHISVDASDRVLVTDTENHVIRVYSPEDGIIRRLAGTGEIGAAGLGGPPEACALDRPHGAVAHPRTGQVYISDSENHRVIRIEK